MGLKKCPEFGYYTGVSNLTYIYTELPSEYVRLEVFTAVTMKNAVFCDKTPAHPSQETHYVSDTEARRLFLCRI
jgi:hypothetical protein